MRLDIPHVFEDKKNKVKLIAESFEETNYGRTFWKFKFYIKGALVNNKLLNYDTDGLLTNLKSYTLASEDGNYIFIPKYNPIVYNLSENKVKEFNAPLKEGNSGFVKNYFHNNKLLIVYRNGIAIINLETNTISSIEYSLKEIYIENVIQIKNEEIELDYRDLTKKEFKKKIIKI